MPTETVAPTRRRGRLLLLVLVVAVLLVALFAYWRGMATDSAPVGTREFAYITNSKSDSVTVLDVEAMRAVGTIAVGRKPTALAGNPLRNEIYVVNTDSDSVSLIDSARNRLAATIAVHHTPVSVSVSADGKRGYVANSGSGDLSVLDLESRRAVAQLRTGDEVQIGRFRLSFVLGGEQRDA